MIIQNALYIPSQDLYVKSSYQHDFVSFLIGEDEGFLDGGTSYIRSGGSAMDKNRVKSFHLDYNSPIHEVLDKLLWGTRGKSGKEDLKYLPIKDLSLDHLKAIIKNYGERGITPIYRFVIEFWIDHKENNDLLPWRE